MIRKIGSYTAQLTQQKIIGEIVLDEMEQKIIKLCKPCYIEAGYKPRGHNDQTNK